MRMNILYFSRRISYLLVAMSLLIVFMVSQPQAQPAMQAKAALESAVTKVLDDIKNPEFANPATRGAIRSRIENAVYQIFDFGEFSSRTVGPRWRTFSPDEKKRFNDAFANLLFNTYLNKIDGYNGEQIAYTGAEVSPNGANVEIKTEIVMKDGKKTPVNYRMLDKNGNWRVYDVIIENISLVRNYRTQFQDILNTATPDQLIARVEQKAQDVIAQGNSKGSSK